MKMSYKILAVDPNLCTGCRVCELVCSLNKEGECNPRKARIRVLKIDKEGFDLPLTCQHCGEPLCKEVCPVNALSRDTKTGAMILNEDVCIGCRSCSMACPFGVISYDYIKGVSRKCDLCEGEPKCVTFCETNALRYERPEILETKKQIDVLRVLVQPLSKPISDNS
jgi:Fe-S-cluster-containing hydrogenase component 2